MSQNTKFKVSIVTRVLVKIGIRIVLVLASVGAISYAVIFAKQEANSIRFLERFTNAKSKKEQADFVNTQNNVDLLTSELIRILTTSGNDKKDFNYKGYLSYVKPTNAKYRQILHLESRSKWDVQAVKTSLDLMVSMSNTWHEIYPQIWVVLNDGSSFGILDEGDRFPLKTQVSEKSNWSELWFDPHSNRWLMDFSQSIVVAGERLGQLNLRVNITEKLKAMGQSLLPNSTMLLVNQSGQVLHSFKRGEEGSFAEVPRQILESDVLIKDALKYVINRNLAIDVSKLNSSKAIVTSNFIAGPGWYSIGLYPKGWIHQDEGSIFKWIVLSSFVYLLFELFILGSSLYQEISFPIRKILNNTENISEAGTESLVLEPALQALQKLKWDISLCDEAIRAVESRIENEITKKDADIAVAKRELLQKLDNSEFKGVNNALESIAAGLTFEIYPAIQRLEQALLQIKTSLANADWSSLELLKKCSFIENEIQKTSKIVMGFLVFARDSKKEEFQVADLDKIVDIALSLCVHRFKREGVSLEVSEIPKVNLECRMAQLIQVLFGLLNNAFEAVVDQPIKLIRLNFKVFNDRLYIEVEDSGSGVPEDLREKIFEPFFSTKTKVSSSGLGLAEARRILRAHRGEIALSHHASLTTFTLELPVTQGGLDG